VKSTDGQHGECNPGNFVQLYQQYYNNQSYNSFKRLIFDGVKLRRPTGEIIAGADGESSADLILLKARLLASYVIKYTLTLFWLRARFCCHRSPVQFLQTKDNFTSFLSELLKLWRL